MHTELRLKKAHMAIMDKIMEADVNGAILKQPRVAQLRSSKALSELMEAGLVESGSEVLGPSLSAMGRFPVTIEGFQFTLLGHLNYCMLCEDCDDEF